MTRLAAPGRDLALQGHYAGAVTRLASYVIDATTISALFAVGAAVFEYLVSNLFKSSFDIADYPVVTSAVFLGWSFVYFAVPLAASGRTFGSAILGLQVVRADGSDLDPRHAVIRTLAFPLSFLLFGFGFLLILVQTRAPGPPRPDRRHRRRLRVGRPGRSAALPRQGPHYSRAMRAIASFSRSM